MSDTRPEQTPLAEALGGDRRGSQRFVARDPKITPAPQMKAALPHPIVAVRAKHSIWANKG